MYTSFCLHFITRLLYDLRRGWIIDWENIHKTFMTCIHCALKKSENGENPLCLMKNLSRKFTSRCELIFFIIHTTWRLVFDWLKSAIQHLFIIPSWSLLLPVMRFSNLNTLISWINKVTKKKTSENEISSHGNFFTRD